MMYGSIFYNFWGALIAFTLYFLGLLLQQSYFPVSILIGSFIVAIIAFFAMYAVRYFISYILYTPEDKIFESFNLQNEYNNQESENEEFQDGFPSDDNLSTVEFQDETSEEIAKVVRKMMNQEDSTSSNT